MQYLKSLSIVILSAAISYLAYSLLEISREVAQVRQQLPVLLDKVEKIEQGADIDAWLTLANNLNQQIPDVLQRVDSVNQSVACINQQLPGILKEVNHIRNETVPSVLTEVKAVRTTTVPAVLSEVKEVRTKTVPPVLAEVAATRKMVPGTLTEVNKLIDKAQTAGKDAAEGAVQGTVKGILLTPVHLLESAGEAIGDAVEDEEANVEGKKNQ